MKSRPVAFLKQTAPRTSERSELQEMYVASSVSFFRRRHFSGVRFPRGMERKFGSLFQFQVYPRMVLDPIHTPVQVAFGDLRMCIKCSFVIASYTSCVFIIFKTCARCMFSFKIISLKYKTLNNNFKRTILWHMTFKK